MLGASPALANTRFLSERSDVIGRESHQKQELQTNPCRKQEGRMLAGLFGEDKEHIKYPKFSHNPDEKSLSLN